MDNVDPNPVVPKKRKYIEASELPEDEKVYLRKGFGGWQVIQPHRDPSTNKIIWKNFLYGGKPGLIRLTSYLIITFILFFAISDLIEDYKDVAENPCNYCSLSSSYNATLVNNLRLTQGINLSNSSFSIKGDLGEAGS